MPARGKGGAISTGGQRRHDAEALLLVAERLHGIEDPDRVLRDVLPLAARLLSVRWAAIATNEGDHALRRYTWDDGRRQACALRLPLDGSLSGRVIHSGQALRLSERKLRRQRTLTCRFPTVLAVPLRARDGSVLGSLNLHERRDGRPFSAGDQRLAEGIAHLAVAALERADLIAELGVQARAVEAATAEQQAFVHTISHALKTPLASIVAMSELLADDLRDADDDVRRGLRLIRRNAERMRDIVNDLLGFARATGGLEDLALEPVELDSVVAASCNELSTQLATRHAHLVVASSLPVVRGHAGRLTEVFTNLLDNAIKYTAADRQPRIEIGARVDGQMVECWVQDNGIGVPVSERERVFGLFERLDAGRALGAEGSGVGLAVVARVVQRQGGRVWIEDGISGGSRFHFTLPAALAELPAASGCVEPDVPVLAGR